MSTEKCCPRCKQTLPALAFYRRHANNPNYLSTHCRTCQRIVSREHAKKHRGSRFYADTLQEYLSQHVIPTTPDQCWKWQGHSHLFLGTAKDNNTDRAKKGRGYTRITSVQVITIRQLREQHISYHKIATLLNIPYTTVYNAAQPHTHPYIKA